MAKKKCKGCGRKARLGSGRLCGNCRNPARTAAKYAQVAKSWAAAAKAYSQMASETATAGPALTGKAAGSAALGKAARPRCAAGHVSKAGATYCTTCGSPTLRMVKSAGDVIGDYIRRDTAAAFNDRYASDPSLRQFAHYQQNPDLRNPWRSA